MVWSLCSLNTEAILAVSRVPLLIWMRRQKEEEEEEEEAEREVEERVEWRG